MQTQDWQELYPKFQEMQQQWMAGVSEFMQASGEQKNAPSAADVLQMNQDFFAQQAALWQQCLQQNQTEAPCPDSRFQATAWQQPGYDWIRQYYLLASQWMMQLVSFLPCNDEMRARLRFFTQQFLDAMSPANFFITNPEVMAKAIETQGASLRQGMDNFLKDAEKGRLSITDESK